MNQRETVRLEQAPGSTRIAASVLAGLMLPPFFVLALVPMLLFLIPVAIVGIPLLIPALLAGSLSTRDEKRRSVRLRVLPQPHHVHP